MSLVVSTPTLHIAIPSSRNPITLQNIGNHLHRSSHDRSTTPALSHAQSPDHNANDDDDDSWSDLDFEGTAPGDGVSGHSDVTNETAARVRKSLQRDLENKLAEGS